MRARRSRSRRASASPPPGEDGRRGQVGANGVRFAYLAWDPDPEPATHPGQAPLALCVHGFPDGPRTWRHLVPRLRAEGYRVVAPWTRGLGPTGPAPDGAYDPQALAHDLIALHHALGGDHRAVLVGHDWGAIAGQLAMADEACPFAAAALLAVPPLGGALGTEALSWPPALAQLGYIAAFQVPGIDRVLGAAGERAVRALWSWWSGRGYDPDDVDLEGALESLAGEGLGNQLAYYRALVVALARGPLLRRVDAFAAPTTFLHGARDRCVHVGIARAAARRPPGQVTVEVLDGLGHWLHLEAPGQVTDRVLAALAPARA